MAKGCDVTCVVASSPVACRKHRKLLQQQQRPVKKSSGSELKRLLAKKQSWLLADERWMSRKPRTAPSLR